MEILKPVVTAVITVLFSTITVYFLFIKEKREAKKAKEEEKNRNEFLEMELTCYDDCNKLETSTVLVPSFIGGLRIALTNTGNSIHYVEDIFFEKDFNGHFGKRPVFSKNVTDNTPAEVKSELKPLSTNYYFLSKDIISILLCADVICVKMGDKKVFKFPYLLKDLKANFRYSSYEPYPPI